MAKRKREIIIRRVFRYSSDTQQTLHEEKVFGCDTVLCSMPGCILESEACRFLTELEPREIVAVCDKVRERHEIIVYYRREELESDDPVQSRPVF